MPRCHQSASGRRKPGGSPWGVMRGRQAGAHPPVAGLLPSLVCVVTLLLSGCAAAPPVRSPASQPEDWFVARHQTMLDEVLVKPGFLARWLAERRALQSRYDMDTWRALSARQARYLEQLRNAQQIDTETFNALMAVIAAEDARRKTARQGDLEAFYAQQAAIEDAKKRRGQQQTRDQSRFFALQAEAESYQREQVQGNTAKLKEFQRLQAEKQAYEEYLANKAAVERAQREKLLAELAAQEEEERRRSGDIDQFNRMQAEIEQAREEELRRMLEKQNEWSNFTAS